MNGRSIEDYYRTETCRRSTSRKSALAVTMDVIVAAKKKEVEEIKRKQQEDRNALLHEILVFLGRVNLERQAVHREDEPIGQCIDGHVIQVLSNGPAGMQ